MNTQNLLNGLRESGLNLSLAGEKLRVTPPGAITPEARAMIREHKAALVDLLRQGVANDPDPTPAASTPAPAVTTQGAMDDDDSQERAAICEFDGGLPREWAEGLARICTMRRPPEFPPHKWRAIIDAAGVFADRWARQASELGWSVQEVFGCHHAAPISRVDAMGLLLAMSGPGVELVELTQSTATFLVGRNRAVQRLRRGEIFTREQRLIFEEFQQ